MVILMNLIKITRQSLPIIFAIMLGARNFLDYPALAEVQIDSLLSQSLPSPPGTTFPSPAAPSGEPNRTNQFLPPVRSPNPRSLRSLENQNQIKPRGELNPSNSSCKSTSKSLTALIPVKNPVLTTRQHPTFLFYVPYASNEIHVGEFSLLVELAEMTTLYKTHFTLPQTPGIVSITLPSKPEYALEEGQDYYWYFELYCQTNTSSQPDVDVNGWVQRVALTPERKRQINTATPDVWYDASAKLAESLRASPQDARLRNDWVNLLKSIGSEDLATELFVGPVIPSQQRLTPRRRQQQVVLSEELIRTFADWCLNKANLSRETLHTVDALLEVVKTQDCNLANKLLSTRTWLNLTSNRITDIRPLSTLINLTRLDLGNNRIADIRPLSTLTKLTTLSLHRNQIADLKPLSVFSNLTRLDLEKNKIADIKPLSTLTNLTELYLEKNKIADIRPLLTLTNLTSLNLKDNQIVDIRPLATLINLTSPNLENNKIADLRPLSILTNLTTLSLQGNQIADLRPLSTLTNLTTVYLYNNQITDLKPLSALTNLTELSLENNKIADLKPLSTLTSLTKLYLGNNQIADLKPLSTLTKLTTLYLANNQIADLKPLSTLTKLTTLYLANNQIADLKALSTLSRLFELSLANNQIADLRPLSTLTYLFELSLENNQIADLKPLSTLTYLTKLFLFNNQRLADKTCPLKPASICIFVPYRDE